MKINIGNNLVNNVNYVQINQEVGTLWIYRNGMTEEYNFENLAVCIEDDNNIDK